MLLLQVQDNRCVSASGVVVILVVVLVAVVEVIFVVVATSAPAAVVVVGVLLFGCEFRIHLFRPSFVSGCQLCVLARLSFLVVFGVVVGSFFAVLESIVLLSELIIII